MTIRLFRKRASQPKSRLLLRVGRSQESISAPDLWVIRALEIKHERIPLMGDAFAEKVRGILNEILERREKVEPFTETMEIVGEVMRHGAASHPDNDWLTRPPEYHIRRAHEHLRLWQDGISYKTISRTPPRGCSWR